MPVTRSEERVEFLGDVITGAVEGGTGYWAQVSQYQYVYKGTVRVCVGEKVGDEPRAVLHPLNDDESGYVAEGREVTLDVIAHGIGVIEGGEIVRDSMKTQILRASRENEAGYLDADDCDVIVQAGLFGEVIYG